MRTGSRLWLPAALAPILVHAVLLLALGPHHTTLTSSVEADFPVYAQASFVPLEEIGWDGFVPLGYPRLLAAMTALVDDMFLAGVLLSSAGGLALLGVTYGLARLWLSPRPAAYLVGVLALNWLVVQSSLLAGTDSIWAALVLGVLLLLAHARRRDSRDLYATAGVVLGLSYLVRYSSIAVAPALVLVLLLDRRRGPRRRRIAHTAAFLAAALVVMSPQLFVAARDAGNPFASHQAKNVWFGMFGEQDWTLNWGGAPDDIALSSVVLGHPEAFVRNLGRNLGYFLAQCLSWPFGFRPEVLVMRVRPLAAAVAFVIAAVAMGWRAGAPARLAAVLRAAASDPDARLVAIAAAVYAAAVSTAFWMPRFLLPLLPLLVLAAGVTAHRVLWPGLRERGRAVWWLLAAFLVFQLAHTVSAWSTFLENGQQPIEEVRVALIAAGIQDDDVVASTVMQHYDNVLPFEFVELPLHVRDLEDLQQLLAAVNAGYLLYEEQLSSAGGSYRPQLDVLLNDPTSCPFLEPFFVRTAAPRLVLFRAR